MRPLRVLQVCHDYQGPFADICRQYAFAFQNYHVTTVFLKGNYRSEVAHRVGGDEVLFFEQPQDSLRGIKLSAIGQMISLCRKRQFDVAIGHRYKSIYLLGLMSYFFSLPVIIGVAHEHEVFRRLSRRLFVTFWRRKIVLVGVSQSVSDNISQYCSSLKGQDRLFTLTNAIDVNQVKQVLPRDVAREKLNLSADDYIIGTVGRLVAKKRHDILIQAFAKLPHTAGMKLLIIGDGPRRAELEALIKSLHLQSRIILAGFQENANQLVRALDVFVLSSGAQEAFGLVLLEAMLGGIPVISSDAPGPKNVVAESGLLFQTDNADDLARTLSGFLQKTRIEQKQMGDSGYERVTAYFSYQKFKDKIWRLPGLRDLSP